MRSDEVRELLREEGQRAGSAHGRWYAASISESYRAAVALAMAGRERPPRRLLKTDLWNECVGGQRDILGRLPVVAGAVSIAVDLSLAVCAAARWRLPRIRVVQADLAALPFRDASFDAVLDLSTLDHLDRRGAERVIAAHSRVLRENGVLLVVFWQYNALLAVRLLAKRLLGRFEKRDQHYLLRAAIRASCGGGMTIVAELAAGSLLLPPQPLTGRLLSWLRPGALSTLLRAVVRAEQSRLARPLLAHVAGRYGIVAVKRRV